MRDHHLSILKILFFALIVGMAFVAPGPTADTVRGALADAYIQVSSFVALTLGIFYMLEHVLKLDTALLLRRYPRWHVPLAAFMGVLPGCGSTIIVITQYVIGRTGFSSVVAALTATMGDAAFLLLAQEPKTAMMVFAICFAAGMSFGYLVEWIHGPDFMREKRETKSEFMAHAERPNIIELLRWPWIALMVPGLVLGIGTAMQVDTNTWFGAYAGYDPTLWVGCAGALLCLFIWSISANAGPMLVNLSGKMTETSGWRIHIERIIVDTNFVTVWVICAYLTFELFMLWSSIDLAALFKTYALFVPGMAVLIGFIPGCGPQILVTTFYLGGLVPFSAMIGNALSNDGDALFPAIALAPKTALLATLYTAFPAFLFAYGWFFLFE